MAVCHAGEQTCGHLQSLAVALVEAQQRDQHQRQRVEQLGVLTLVHRAVQQAQSLSGLVLVEGQGAAVLQPQQASRCQLHRTAKGMVGAGQITLISLQVGQHVTGIGVVRHLFDQGLDRTPCGGDLASGQQGAGQPQACPGQAAQRNNLREELSRLRQAVFSQQQLCAQPCRQQGIRLTLAEPLAAQLDGLVEPLPVQRVEDVDQRLLAFARLDQAVAQC